MAFWTLRLLLVSALLAVLIFPSASSDGITLAQRLSDLSTKYDRGTWTRCHTCGTSYHSIALAATQTPHPVSDVSFRVPNMEWMTTSTRKNVVPLHSGKGSLSLPPHTRPINALDNLTPDDEPRSLYDIDDSSTSYHDSLKKQGPKNLLHIDHLAYITSFLSSVSSTTLLLNDSRVASIAELFKERTHMTFTAESFLLCYSVLNCLVIAVSFSSYMSCSRSTLTTLLCTRSLRY